MRRFFQQVGLTIFSLALVAVGIFACNQGEKPKANNTFPCSMQTPKRPHMWVDYRIGQSNETTGLHYAGFLTSLIGKPETDSFYYSVAEFKGMIDYFGTLSNMQYVDVYLVVDTGTLNFLYAPVYGNNQTLYFRLPENATSFDPVGDLIDPTLAQTWKTNYANTVEKYLNSTLDTSDPGNYLDCKNVGNPKYLLNTGHTAYFYSYWQELETELSYQACAHHDTITGFKVFLSVQPYKAKGGQLVYSNRLFPLIEFTRDVNNNHQEFYIDTTDGFYGANPRPIQTPIWPGTASSTCPTTFLMVDAIKSGDNGQMCPPTCTP